MVVCSIFATFAPENLKSKYDKLTIQTYQVIASIVQDIIYAYEEYEIDYSFLEAIFMEKLDYFKKMKLINDYRDQTWKEITNSSYDPNKRLGFSMKGDR